jgi:hypothetical protein
MTEDLGIYELEKNTEQSKDSINVMNRRKKLKYFIIFYDEESQIENNVKNNLIIDYIKNESTINEIELTKNVYFMFIINCKKNCIFAVMKKKSILKEKNINKIKLEKKEM